MRTIYETIRTPRKGAIFEFHLQTRTVDWTIWRMAYERGYRPPRYPVPAIPVHIGFMPTGTGAMRGVPYIWLTAGYNRLITFWKGLDTIEEWYDTDGKRHLKRVVTMSHMGKDVNEK